MNLVSSMFIRSDKKLIRPQGLIKKNKLLNDKDYARHVLRDKLGLNANAKIILGMGVADKRKGIDLFLEIGLKVLNTHPNTYFVWVGSYMEGMQDLVENRLAHETMAKHFILDGFNSDTDIYFAGADIFALTSREDPFPSVVLESLEVGIPVIGFANSGGFSDILEKGCGVLIPPFDTNHFSREINSLLNNPHIADQLGQCGAAIIQESYLFNHYIFDLLKYLDVTLKKVSVIVPNYNYAKYLEARLLSILKQTYPVLN